ncbi:hypothetical protein L615_002100000470 [Nocardioides sp. J9]|uniref:hypothetical protein n=1 Tax=Nocardioides sp. J9 TaxID=935844 RepID=UPI0011A8259D|nr:hypothetical protein [Nocardioides sp. J9]TWH00552.1 hypothetical protein L615_002100000470 [Nocardioides sp. J9]
MADPRRPARGTAHPDAGHSAGYLPVMELSDLLTCLGEDHLDREQLPVELRELVDEALLRGLVLEDCRGQLTSLA